MKFGLLGYPLGHSLSPQIHQMLFAVAGKESFSYELYARESLSAFSDSATLDGFNVTIPYKTEILPHLDKTDEKVDFYRACNTVVRRGNALFGYNTDVDGFLETLHANHIQLKDKKVLVTGFGGVSKMMTLESVIAGADVTVAIRKEEKLASVQEEILKKTGKKVKVTLSPEEAYQVVLQGTPAGMYPNVVDSPVPLSVLKETDFAFDTIYNPVTTLFTNAVNFAGGKGVNGLTMLVCQAGVAQKHFYGATFASEDYQKVEQEVKKLLKPLSFSKNIILIGPPGSGKSTLMKGIAQIFGLEAVDLDTEIERQQEMEIKDIFASKGEAFFRTAEKNAALQCCSGTGKLISTGGGIVETEDCMEALFENPDNLILSLLPSKEILLARLAGDKKRPLLSGNMDEKLSALLERRMPLYERYAKIPILLEKEISPAENVLSVCDKILAYCKKMM